MTKAEWRARRAQMRRARAIVNLVILGALLLLVFNQSRAIHNLQEDLQEGLKGGLDVAMICVYGGECNGCMRCQQDPEPIYCEICGEEVEYLYKNADGEVVGCDNCIKQVDPYC